MARTLSNESSLENLKREAKRWLRMLRENDSASRERLLRATPNIIDNPSLRDVQHALAREHAFDSWIALTAAVERIQQARAQLKAGANAGDTQMDEALHAFLLAASKGEIADIKRMLADRPQMASARARLTGHIGERSALHFALGAPNALETVQTLLALGADPNVRDEGDNAFPLHFVAERRELDIVRALLDRGADTDGEGDDHELGVMGWATVFGDDNFDVAREMLNRGAVHTLPSAVAMGDVDAITNLVARYPERLDMKLDSSNRHRTLLHLAVIKKQPASIDALLRLGIDTNGTDVAGLTALDQAAIEGRQEYVQQLIDAGVPLPLPAAISLGRTQDVERILRADSEVLKPGQKYGQLIVQASERGSPDTIRSLLHYGADVNARALEDSAIDGTSGYTALHAAAFHGNMAVVEVLLEAGANARAREDKFCATPAGWAWHGKHEDVARRILREDVDIFDAAAFNMPDRIRVIVARDPGALRRPLGTYVNCIPTVSAPWKNPNQRPLDAARQWESAEAEAVLVELLAASNASNQELVARFLTTAAPDWRVTTGSEIRTSPNTARRLLQQHPELATENIFTALVCGNVARVQELLSEDAEAASRADVARNWSPLLHLSTSRLPLPAAADHSVEIARLLLEHGADPNAYCPGGQELIGYDEGDIHFTVLTNIVGRGEGRVPPHAHVRALVKLVLERGANPYDKQLLYNVFADHSSRSDLRDSDVWLLDLLYEQSVRNGHADDWKDSLWRMLDVGSYGPGANFILQATVRTDNVGLTEWCLKHGANPDAKSDNARFAQTSPAEDAMRGGNVAMQQLMARYSKKAATNTSALSPYEQFMRACLNGDEVQAREAVAAHPEWLTVPHALIIASRQDNADAVRLLLSLGVSPDIDENFSRSRALHAAAFRGATRAAKVLIDAGADVDARESNYGSTPMGVASWAQQSAMTDLLAEYSRDLFQLIAAGKVDRVREVLRQEPSLAKVLQRNGESMLMRLPDNEEDAVALVQLLLANGADPSLRNEYGLTAADIAERRSMMRVVPLLRV